MYPTSRTETLPKTKKLIRWITPPDGWVKLNVDGASHRNPGTTGGGGVLRNQNSQWIRGFTANFGTCSSVKAELLALLQGLRMAWMYGVKKLIIEVDSMSVFNQMQVLARQHHLHYFTIKACQEYIYSTHWSMVTEHCYREANRLADQLANLGIEQLEAFILLDHPPESVETNLVEDMLGVTRTCLVRN